MSKQLALIAEKTGAVVLPDSNGWTNRLEIRSASSNKKYVVAQRQNKDGQAYGDFACSCLGWIMSQKRGTYTCKHLDAMRPILKAAFPSAAPAQETKPVTKQIGR